MSQSCTILCCKMRVMIGWNLQSCGQGYRRWYEVNSTSWYLVISNWFVCLLTSASKISFIYVLKLDNYVVFEEKRRQMESALHNIFSTRATLVTTCDWMSESHSVMCDSLQPHGLWPTRLLCSRDYPGKNTGVGFHFLLQGIFLTQGSNPGLPHCRQMLYCLSHQGS